MYMLKEAMDMFCRDLLASHQRKCEYALAGLAPWRFFSHQKVVESLLVGTWYKPLQNVSYHDSCSHGYEWSGVPVGLVGILDGMDWLCLDRKSQWATVIGWCNLQMKGELTYSLSKVVDFVISRVDIT
jgi:hypothetical protein